MVDEDDDAEEEEDDDVLSVGEDDILVATFGAEEEATPSPLALQARIKQADIDEHVRILRQHSEVLDAAALKLVWAVLPKRISDAVGSAKSALTEWHTTNVAEVDLLLRRTACVLSDGGFDHGEARPLASIAYGVCKGGVPRAAAQTLLQTLRPVACARLSELRAVELSQVRPPRDSSACGCSPPVPPLTCLPMPRSQLLWAYATVGGHGAELLFLPAAEEIVGVRGGVGDFDAQALSNTLWSYATAGVRAEALFNLAADEVIAQARMGEFSSQGLANVAWAFAKARVAAATLFEGIAATTLPLIATFQPQSVSNLVWAFATAGAKAEELFEAVSKEVARRGVRVSDGWSAQALSIVAWAYATAQAPGRDVLLDTVAAEVASRGLRGFQALGAANLLWACGTSACTAAPKSANAPVATTAAEVAGCSTHRAVVVPLSARLRLFEAVATSGDIVTQLHAFDPRQLSNIIWAFATVGVRAPALFAAVGAAAIRRGLGSFSARELSETLWAYATVEPAGHVELFEAAATEIARRLRDTDDTGASERVSAAAQLETHLPGVLWAYAVVGSRGESALDLFGVCLPHVAALVAAEAWTPAELRLVHEWQLSIELEFTLLDRRDELLLPATARAACRDALAQPARASDEEAAVLEAAELTRDVTSVLARLHPRFTEGVREPTTRYTLPLAWADRKIAVVVEGRRHVVHTPNGGEPPSPDGRTHLVDRLLRAAGWKLAIVSFHKWHLCEDAPRDWARHSPRSLDDRRNVLRAALRHADPGGQALGTSFWR